MLKITISCIFRREILSRPPTENVTSVTGITVVTSAAPPISELLHLQVLDEIGYPVDEVITYQSIRLRVQALTTPGIVAGRTRMKTC